MYFKSSFLVFLPIAIETILSKFSNLAKHLTVEGEVKITIEGLISLVFGVLHFVS